MTAEIPTQPGGSAFVERRPRRRHPVARGFGLVVGWLCTLAAALGLAAHFLDTRHQSLIVLASGAWALVPFGVVALALHLWRRGWFAVVIAVLIIGIQVVVYAPLFVAEPAPAGGTVVHVFTQNMLWGEADATALVARVRASDTDVFVAQELTSAGRERLRAAGLDALLTHAVVDPRSNYTGTGMWSRYPLTGQVRLATQGLEGVTARIALPDGVTLTAVTLHPAAPFPQSPADWYADLKRIRTVLAAVPSGPVVVGGDFNSTVDHAHFRRLLVNGWRDGAEQAGAGLIRSWPTTHSLPALVGIDHVLTRGTVATSVRTVPAPGSDHLGLLATVVVPR